MYRHFFKRVFDLIFALCVLPFWLIILIIFGPIIYLQDRGPIFYNAPRMGRHGKVYTMYKFRSMKVNAPDIRLEDGSTYNAKDDPRVTKIGQFIRKTSIDETPQFLNVIKGDMSIIGPRPNLVKPYGCLSPEETARLAVRPGITGYSQAYFRNSISAQEKYANDLFYIENLSMGLDFRIFLATIYSVISGQHIFIEDDSSCYQGELIDEKEGKHDNRG